MGFAIKYSHCRAPTGETYQELLVRLGVERIRYPGPKGSTVWLALEDDPGVHLDPDLYAPARTRPVGWRPCSVRSAVRRRI